MKIAQFIPNLKCGGAESFVVSLSNELSKSPENDVTIVTFYTTEPEYSIEYRLSPNVKLHLIKKRKGIDFLLPFKIARYLSKNKYDVAHFHVQAIIYSIMSAIAYRKCKHVATIHTDAYKEATGLHRLVRKFLFKNKLVKPVTISSESERSFKELYKINGILIHNGVDEYIKKEDIDISKYKTTENTIVLINVGTIYPIKNQVNIAKAVDLLIKEGYDISILFLGKPANIDFYKKLKEYESNRIFLLGNVNYPTDYLAKCDFFILASLYEGLPISLLEAFSVNAIPIVTPVGGCTDIVNEKTGIICINQEVDSIMNAIKEAVSLTNEAKTDIKKQIHTDFQKYTMRGCAQNYMSLFQNK